MNWEDWSDIYGTLLVVLLHKNGGPSLQQQHSNDNEK